MASIKFKVNTRGLDTVREKLVKACSEAEHTLAQQVAKDTEPFVPASGAPAGMYERTVVDGNKVIYPGPYARYLYNGKVMVNAATGKGPSKFADKNGNEVFYFPKGSTLKATDKNLVFSKAHHGQAQSHWFEASKAQNMRKWEQVAEKAVSKDFGKK